MPSLSAWLVSFRLRTLPLALSTVILGSFLAAYQGRFKWSILILAVITTLFLQILSNLANDYGDTVHGTDNHERIGPKRSLQTGDISLKQMKTAVIIFVLLSLVSGIWLLWEGMKDVSLSYGLIMFIIGIAAIGAALKYTIGKNPYGYAGLGDFAVFIFFGLTGVMGTYFLQTHYVSIPEFLPAMAIGFFSTGVLNLNNMRDRINDEASGKFTMVVRMGTKPAKIYHAVLIISGWIAALVYSVYAFATPWKWIYILTLPIFISSIMVVMKNSDPQLLDPELKKLAIGTLLFSILFGCGLLIGH